MMGQAAQIAFCALPLQCVTQACLRHGPRFQVCTYAFFNMVFGMNLTACSVVFCACCVILIIDSYGIP